MHDSRETRLTKAFITGFPVKHSRSPIIHNYWIGQLGLDAVYERAEIHPDDFPDFIARLRDGSLGYVGGNVTIPHKEMAATLADHRDALVEELGAANTLWVEDGRVHATNTDMQGFLGNLDERAPGWDRISKAIVLGAGGASRAVIGGLKSRGIGEIHVVNRTVGKAKELASQFGPTVWAHPMDALEEVTTGAGLFVNTTSLGMHGQAVPELPLERLAQGAVVNDAVYIPLETPILAQARRQGLATVDGLGMLLHQAVPAFEKWFHHRPTVTEELRQLIIADMEHAA